jgi:hypothetical protein
LWPPRLPKKRMPLPYKLQKNGYSLAAAAGSATSTKGGIRPSDWGLGFQIQKIPPSHCTFQFGKA